MQPSNALGAKWGGDVDALESTRPNTRGKGNDPAKRSAGGFPRAPKPTRPRLSIRGGVGVGSVSLSREGHRSGRERTGAASAALHIVEDEAGAPEYECDNSIIITAVPPEFTITDAVCPGDKVDKEDEHFWAGEVMETGMFESLPVLGVGLVRVGRLYAPRTHFRAGK
eukprot:g13156.t1